MKNLFKKTDQKGFTIIEVMIVLAIGALILVVVLIAIPQLQANQRNSARQNVISRVMTELSSYAGNNNGQYPETATGLTLADFESRYLTNVNYEDPTTGSNYNLSLATAVADAQRPSNLGDAVYFVNAQCNGESVAAGSGSRNIALVILLEGGNRFFCVDNS